jgi:hypothetical protein
MSVKNKIRLCLALIITLMSDQVLGADSNVATSTVTLGLPEVALLKVNAGVITLTLEHQDAGESVEPSKSDSTARLLVSSVIRSSARTLSAKITSGSVPAGTQLSLTAMTPNTSFVGTSGTLGSQVVLDATDRTIVTGIGTCYSGTNTNDGFPLKYTFALAEGAYGSLRATTGTQVVVTLTLTAAQ